MTLRNDKKINSAVPFTTAKSTRRDFIKLCGTAGVGGFSGLLLPNSSETDSSLDLIKTKASKGIFDELFWSFVRLQFILQPGIIYMNTGTEGSMPRRVISRLNEYLKEFASNPWEAVIDHDCYCYTMPEVISNVAEFLGTGTNEIVMTTNTTEGMSFVANGLDLREGDEVLTTLHEHSAGLVCWDLLKERRGVTVTRVELPTPANNEDEIVEAFENAITENTRVMSFCHINYTTGLRMPVKALSQLARNRNILSVVDGAHAIGMLDLNLHDLGCDFYATSPHKWLNAPPGTGVLFMREEVQDLVWPTVTEHSASRNGTDVFQVRGQQCTPAYRGVIDAIDFQRAIGKDEIEGRVLALSTYLKEKIIETWGENKLFSPTNEAFSTGLVSFNPFDEPFDAGKVKIYKLLRDDYKIIIRSVSFRDKHSDDKNKRALRVSTHIFNNYREIDKLVNTLQKLMGTV